MNVEKNKHSLLSKLQWVQDLSDASFNIEEIEKDSGSNYMQTNS